MWLFLYTDVSVKKSGHALFQGSILIITNS